MTNDDPSVDSRDLDHGRNGRSRLRWRACHATEPLSPPSRVRYRHTHSRRLVSGDYASGIIETPTIFHATGGIGRVNPFIDIRRMLI